jgi:hypothetical protein
MQITLDRSTIRHDRVHRLVARCAMALVPVVLWSTMPVAASAQSGLAPQTNFHGPFPAPIGHRQPRAQDLPPDVLRDEGMARQAPEPPPASRPKSGRQGSGSGGPFGGGDLRICRQC